MYGFVNSLSFHTRYIELEFVANYHKTIKNHKNVRF